MDLTASGKPRVALLIDDDDVIRRFVRERLEADGFSVVEAPSGLAGLELFGPGIDIVVVDVGLPDIDGFLVLRSLRQRSNVPIVMMTAAADEIDRVLGLELGADDYIVKPFLPREFIARVRAAVRRAELSAPQTPTHEHLDFGDLSIDLVAREATIDGAVLGLTAREFDLLAFLARSPRQVFSREQLLRQVWQAEPGWVNDATVTEHVRRVRNRIGVSTSGVTIHTVRGAGYRFEPGRFAAT